MLYAILSIVFWAIFGVSFLVTLAFLNDKEVKEAFVIFIICICCFFAGKFFYSKAMIETKPREIISIVNSPERLMIIKTNDFTHVFLDNDYVFEDTSAKIYNADNSKLAIEITHNGFGTTKKLILNTNSLEDVEGNCNE